MRHSIVESKFLQGLSLFWKSHMILMDLILLSVQTELLNSLWTKIKIDHFRTLNSLSSIFHGIWCKGLPNFLDLLMFWWPGSIDCGIELVAVCEIDREIFGWDLCSHFLVFWSFSFHQKNFACVQILVHEGCPFCAISFFWFLWDRIADLVI